MAAPRRLDRRSMMSIGLGAATASFFLGPQRYLWAASGSTRRETPHFQPQARRVVFCFMQGGMSHVDLFDPKPMLEKHHGEVATMNNAQSQVGGERRWLQSPWKFQQFGDAGIPFSNLLPYLSSCADDLTVIRSMKGGLPLHSVGNLFLHSGRNRAGFPSLGSWVNYGLGSENPNLPGYILLHFDEVLPGGMENFSNGFLPAQHQATPIRAAGIPIDNLERQNESAQSQLAKLEFLKSQDRALSERLGGQQAMDAAVANYELAYRMQSHLPEVMDIESETPAMQKMYGLGCGNERKEQYAAHCLRARRLIEAGVRFVEIVTPPGFSTNGAWDQHGDLKKGHEGNALVVDQPISALIRDLKSRGLFDETLIIICGEMGRTPHSASNDGRDHHTSCFSALVMGGGFKAGAIHGQTDDFGMEVVQDPVSIHDLHATILHQLGMDHTRLTFLFGGRNFTLPDVEGQVVHDLLGASDFIDPQFIR